MSDKAPLIPYTDRIMAHDSPLTIKRLPGERFRKPRRARKRRKLDLAGHSEAHELHISKLERGTPLIRATGEQSWLIVRPISGFDFPIDQEAQANGCSAAYCWNVDIFADPLVPSMQTALVDVMTMHVNPLDCPVSTIENAP